LSFRAKFLRKAHETGSIRSGASRAGCLGGAGVRKRLLGKDAAGPPDGPRNTLVHPRDTSHSRAIDLGVEAAREDRRLRRHASQHDEQNEGKAEAQPSTRGERDAKHLHLSSLKTTS
jgi:hypothetical protein